jgi:hypothetical protein
MNRAKRKARQAVHKQRSREPEETTSNGDEVERKRPKLEPKEENNVSMGMWALTPDSVVENN